MNLNPVLDFLLKSTVISGMMLAYYWLFLKNKKLHNYNRFYLLATITFSFVLPLLHFHWPTSIPLKSPDLFAIRNIDGISESNESISAYPTSGINIQLIISIVYATMSLFLLLKMLLKIVQVYRIKRRYEVIATDGFDLVKTNISGTPFSFMQTLFWNNNIPVDSDEGRKIWAHETMHIRQYHSLDKIYTQISIALFWINPFYWILQKELCLQHEFIADDAAIPDGDTDAFARMLLTASQPSFSSNIVHTFFQSSIKQRLFMMTQQSKTSYAGLRKLLVVPVVLGLTTLFAFSNENRSDAPKAAHKVILVLDPAHGGRDPGATNRTNGVHEKDLTLGICKKMEQLAGDYNIAIITTRNSDEMIAFEDRLKIANGSNAGLLISIHVNSHPINDTKKSGFEVLLNSKRNEHEVYEKVLASSLVNELEKIKIQALIRKQSLRMFKENTLPTIAIECGDINDANDFARLTNDGQLEAFCRKILASIVGYDNYVHKH